LKEFMVQIATTLGCTQDQKAGAQLPRRCSGV
jgi:hypothetical protein